VSERLFMEHRVGVNEDLFLLAELYYGNAEKWSVIYHENIDVIGDDPEALKPGTPLRIPLVATSERHGVMPEVPTGGQDAHYDPLVSLARDEYGDPSMSFDLRERNSLSDDQVVSPGTALRFPAQGEKHNLNLALRWRQQFRRKG
jgi:hypothetical protein